MTTSGCQKTDRHEPTCHESAGWPCQDLSFLTIAQQAVHWSAETDFAAALAALAEHLLNRTDFMVAGQRHRLAEVEVYYTAPHHPDPFTHCDPRQREFGRWYFHRSRGGYRGGSFQGLDLTLGDGTAYLGLLIRSLVTPAGTVIAGPSLVVDHLLAQTQAGSVAKLDHNLSVHTITDRHSPLHLVAAVSPRTAPLYTTARVGLSLQRMTTWAPEFIGRPYRYLTEPATIPKGKVQLVLALHRQGRTVADIRALTGVSPTALTRYLANYAIGQKAPSFDVYYGQALTTAQLCQLLGTWDAHFGSAAASHS